MLIVVVAGDLVEKRSVWSIFVVWWIAGLVNLEELQISRSKVNDTGIAALKGLLTLICISLGTRISEGNKVAMVYSPMTYQVACFYGGSAAPVVLSLQASHIYITSCVLSVCADHVSWKHGHGVILRISLCLAGLKKLRSLSMEGCPVTSQCMETIGGIVQRHRGTTFL